MSAAPYAAHDVPRFRARAAHIVAARAAAQRCYRRALVVAASAHGFSKQRLECPSTHPERRARHVALYLAIVGGNVPSKTVARVVGLHQATVEEAVAKIEERRDEPRFDTWLSRLEDKVQAAARNAARNVAQNADREGLAA